MFNDLRYGIRMLLKSPGFTTIAVLTLALGIGANTALFSVIKGVLLRPLPYPDPDQLVMLWESNPRLGFDQDLVTGRSFTQWKDQNRVFEQMAFWPSWFGTGHFTVMGREGRELVTGEYASASLFPLLGVKPILGRTFLPEEDQQGGNRVVVIGHGLWQRRFGADPDVLGQTLKIDRDGLLDWTIIGVMPPGFQFPGKAELWLPAGWMGVGLLREYEGMVHYYNVVARLRPGVTLEQARGEINTIQRQIAEQYPDSRIGSQVKIVSLLDKFVSNIRPVLLVLLGAVVFVLLIACANVANLLLARATTRQKDVAIRRALGASRWRVIRQLLTESLLLSSVGGALGALLARWGIDVLVAFGGENIPRSEGVQIDGSVLGFTLLVSLLTGITFGLAPAFTASKPNLNESLKEGSRSSTESIGRNRMRSVLVVSQVALALILLVGAGLMVQSFLRLYQVNPGFQLENLLIADFDMGGTLYNSAPNPWNPEFRKAQSPHAFFQQLMERIKAIPGVQSVGGSWAKLPLDGTEGGGATTITIEGRPPMAREEFVNIDVWPVTPDYFRTMGTPLVKGRFFTERDSKESPLVAIISERLARRYFPNEDPIGKRLILGDSEDEDRNGQPDWREIVGVVGDVRIRLDAETGPAMYYPYWQWPWYFAHLVVRTTSDPMTLAARLRSEVRALNKDQPVYSIRTMEQVRDHSIAQPGFRTLLLSLFGAVALVLAAVGIYGVMAYSVTQRTHEIGIRMALGAQQKDVLKLVVRQGMVLTLIGVAIGLAAASGLTRVLSSFLFGVTATDPATFVGVSLLLAGVALLACYIPACKATKVDPMVALRYE